MSPVLLLSYFPLLTISLSSSCQWIPWCGAPAPAVSCPTTCWRWVPWAKGHAGDLGSPRDLQSLIVGLEVQGRVSWVPRL